MKLIKVIPIAILILILSVTIASATHTTGVNLSPTEWASNTEKDVSLKVTNTGGDNIVKVELSVPETDDKPLYIITEYGSPEGWTYEKRFKDTNPYKIIWRTTGKGISATESKIFGFKVRSPENPGEFEWKVKTIDSEGDEVAKLLTTKVSTAPVSYFVISEVPDSVKAGSSFKIKIEAYSEDKNVKTDYTGTVSFTSTDSKAIIPEDYTFKSSDKGSKNFYITYKTVANQSFVISDKPARIVKESIITTVEPSDATSITISPKDSEVKPERTIEFKAEAKDKFGNKFDVTEETVWSIDTEAGGKWTENVYTSENEGIWTVTGNYKSVIDGTSLTVTTKAEMPPEEEEPPEEEVPPEEEIPPEEEELPVTPIPEEIMEMSITGPDSIIVAPGANESFVLTIENSGTSNLTEISISAMGIPTEWVLSYPAIATIEAGESKDFLVVVSVPENETEEKTIEFIAASLEGASAIKNVSLSIATGPTAVFIGLSKNLLNLGIVIIAVAALILIAWELWFRKPK